MVALIYRRSGNFQVGNNSRKKIFVLINFRGFFRSAVNGSRFQYGRAPGEFPSVWSTTR